VLQDINSAAIKTETNLIFCEILNLAANNQLQRSSPAPHNAIAILAAVSPSNPTYRKGANTQVISGDQLEFTDCIK
jgi:hypothetical protein